MPVLSVRIDEDLEKRIEMLMKRQKMNDKSAYIRQLLDRSVEQDLIDFLAIEVENARISTWKAAEIAGISLRSMMEELKKRNITRYTKTEFIEDLKFAKGRR